MLTAADFYKIQKDTNHIPEKKEKKKIIKTSVSKVAEDIVLGELKKSDRFFTILSLVALTGYSKQTVQRVIRHLRDKDAIMVKEVKTGRAKALHIKYKKEILK